MTLAVTPLESKLYIRDTAAKCRNLKEITRELGLRNMYSSRTLFKLDPDK
jgi:hypothetical protein